MSYVMCKNKECADAWCMAKLLRSLLAIVSSAMWRLPSRWGSRWLRAYRCLRALQTKKNNVSHTGARPGMDSCNASIVKAFWGADQNGDEALRLLKAQPNVFTDETLHRRFTTVGSAVR